MNTRVQLDEADIYGIYRVDPAFFPGPQADWQHDHYRITVAEDRTITLTERYDGGGAVAFSGRYEFIEGYIAAPRLCILPDQFIHHLLSDNPTLYRENWGFYYVFHSPEYGNVFFRKER